MMETEYGLDLAWVPDVHTKFQCKAGAFRGLVPVLREHGWYATVYDESPRGVRELLANPPLPTSWMSGVAFQYVIRSVHRQAGHPGVRTLARESIISGPLKMMQPVVQSIMRLFGADPNAFYRRLPQMMEGQIRGMEFRPLDLRANHATIEVEYSCLKNVPLEAFVYWESAFCVTHAICGTHGDASTTTLPSTHGNLGRVELSWEKR